MGFQYKVISSMEKVFASASNIQEIESKVLSGLKGEIV